MDFCILMFANGRSGTLAYPLQYTALTLYLSMMIYINAVRIVNRFCKRSLNDRFLLRFQKTIVSFSKKTIVFKNDTLVLNF